MSYKCVRLEKPIIAILASKSSSKIRHWPFEIIQSYLMLKHYFNSSICLHGEMLKIMNYCGSKVLNVSLIMSTH